MFEIYDLNNCPFSIRDGSYGGMAGDKDGIEFNNENWIVKFPKSAKDLNNVGDLSYVTSPLSEFLGSHIYSILGYDVHDTILGIRQNKLVVACKDFCDENEKLYEMRTIKNSAHKEIEELANGDISSFSESSSNDIDLDETIFHLNNNRILKQTPNCKNRFWECCIIDILINNNDRNNGNWGVIVNTKNKNYSLAPVFDNGNSFYNKFSDNKILNKIEHNEYQDILGTRTIYSYKGKVLSSKKFLNLDFKDLEKAVLKLYPIIKDNMDKIFKFIDSIPEQYNGYNVFSKERKENYKLSLSERLEKLIKPKYEKTIQNWKYDLPKPKKH